MSAIAPSLYERLRLRKLDRVFAGLIDPDEILMRHDDVYLLLDSFWVRSAAPRAVERLRRRGHNVVVVVYDVLPLTDPAFFVAGFSDLLARQLRRIARAGARFVAISAHSARQTEAVLADCGPVEVSHFPLGFDFPTDDRSFPAAVEQGGELSFLVVGTLEPRKNHGIVLDAFEQRWAAGWPGTLTIIGKPGWGVAPLLDRLESHPERGHRLFVEHSATDARLSEAYRQASATIVPSLAEGFGLPIIESMSLGVPVIASDIAVFREILGDDPLLFDPHDSIALSASIDRLIADPATFRARARAFSWPDWQASATALVEVIDRRSP